MNYREGFAGDGGRARGRCESRDNIDRQDKLARRERIEASAIRKRLERQSGPGEGRASLGRIVAMATVDAMASRSLEGTLDALRKVAQLTPLRRAQAEREGTRFSRPGYGSDGRRNSTLSDPNFELRGSRSRFDPLYADEIAPSLRAERVRDAGGRMIGGMSTEDSGDNSDHWADGEVSDVGDVLSSEDMAHNAARALRNRFF